MNDIALIGVSIISGCFSLAAISLLQHNWYKKEQAKHSYYIKRLKYQNRAKSTAPPPPAPSPSGAMDWLQTLQNLPPDLLHAFVDQFAGDEKEPTGEGGLSETILNMVEKNPDIVKDFLANYRDKGSSSSNAY